MLLPKIQYNKHLNFLFMCVIFPTLLWASQQPTPEQVQQFKSLSPAEQQLILNSVSTSNVSATTPANAPQLSEPKLVNERTNESLDNKINDVVYTKSIEENANKSANAPELKEKKEEKIVKQKLKQFGYDLFAGSPTTFAPATDIPIPVDYIVGPGDTVIVQYYGKQNNTNELVIGRDGALKLPSIGPVSVAGLTFVEMKKQLLEMISNQLIGVNASIGLGTLRSIRVFVLGEAFRPGSYTISALSTMTNALFVSGGVTSVGSLRKVQLKRQGNIVAELDLYDLLIKGDTSNDSRLIPGDVIFVPPIGETAGVSGEVRRPAIYELKNEKTSEEILQLAGGLLPTAYPKASRIERINQKGDRTLVDLDLSSEEGKQLQPLNGDVLQVFSVLDKMEDVVMLKGHAERPGGFQWRKGMRISDVIQSPADLLPNPDLDYALIHREVQPIRMTEIIPVNLRQALKAKGSTADIKLMPRDELIVFGLSEPRNEQVSALVEQLTQQQSFSQPAKIVEIQGNVRFPGVYPLVKNMTLKDLIKSSYDLQSATDRSYVLIKRIEDKTGRIKILRERLDNIDGFKQPDFYLKSKDVVYIFDTETDRAKLVLGLVGSLQRQANINQNAEIISVTGNLRFPGVYPWTDGMNLQDAVDAAYRLNKNTALDYVILTRTIDNQGRIEFRSLDLRQRNIRTIPLLPQDVVHFFEQSENRQVALKPVIAQLKRQATKTLPTNVVQLDGLVRYPGEYPLEPQMSLARLLTAGGGFSESAYGLSGEITRFQTSSDNQSVVHQPVYLTDAGDKGLGLILQAKDQLQIKQIPNWMEKETIEILGEVRFPGVYSIAKGESLAQLVARAGGLTEFADPRAAVFTRNSLKIREQEQLNKFHDQLQRDLAVRSLQQSNAIDKSKEANSESLVMSQSLLQQLESTKAVGRLVVDLPSILSNSYQGNALVLEMGDRLVVPRARQEVTTLGEVNFPTSHLYQPGFKLDDYIYGSGGLTAKADDARVYIIKANGSVLARNQSESWFRSKTINTVEPGDTVVVPLNVESLTDWQKWTNVSQILFQLATTTAALKTVGAF